MNAVPVVACGGDAIVMTWQHRKTAAYGTRVLARRVVPQTDLEVPLRTLLCPPVPNYYWLRPLPGNPHAAPAKGGWR